MSIQAAVKTARLISVHDQPDTLRLELSSITPGTYFVPGINAPDKEFEKCVFSLHGGPAIQYAVRKELNGKKYVEIQVFEGKTPQYGTEFNMKTDEQGRLMVPPLQRALLTVPAEDIANELERQSCYFDQNLGVQAVDHEITVEDVVLAETENLKFLRRLVQETSKYSKWASGNITEQAKAAAWRLHKLGLLNPLPEWATVNPEGGTSFDTFNCIGCGAVLPKTAGRCNACPSIYNWKMAVDLGWVPPRDVPPSKRIEAGLEGTKYAKTGQADRVAAQVAEDFQTGQI